MQHERDRAVGFCLWRHRRDEQNPHAARISAALEPAEQRVQPAAAARVEEPAASRDTRLRRDGHGEEPGDRQRRSGSRTSARLADARMPAIRRAHRVSPGSGCCAGSRRSEMRRLAMSATDRIGPGRRLVRCGLRRAQARPKPPPRSRWSCAHCPWTRRPTAVRSCSRRARGSTRRRVERGDRPEECSEMTRYRSAQSRNRSSGIGKSCVIASRRNALPLVASQTRSKRNASSACRMSPCGSTRCGSGLTSPVARPAASMTSSRYCTFTSSGSRANRSATTPAASGCSMSSASRKMTTSSRHAAIPR